MARWHIIGSPYSFVGGSASCFWLPDELVSLNWITRCLVPAHPTSTKLALSNAGTISINRYWASLDQPGRLPPALALPADMLSGRTHQPGGYDLPSTVTLDTLQSNATLPAAVDVVQDACREVLQCPFGECGFCTIRVSSRFVDCSPDHAPAVLGTARALNDRKRIRQPSSVTFFEARLQTILLEGFGLWLPKMHQGQCKIHATYLVVHTIQRLPLSDLGFDAGPVSAIL